MDFQSIIVLAVIGVASMVVGLKIGKFIRGRGGCGCGCDCGSGCGGDKKDGSQPPCSCGK